MINIIKLDSREDLYQQVADKIALQLKNALARDGIADFIVPGGTTPAPVFEKLSKMSLAWNCISVSPSDERWIATDHEQSNQNLLEKTLLINKASVAHLIPLKNSAETAAEGEELTEMALKGHYQPSAVTMVGMGPDSHFASLFPGTPQIEEALDNNSGKRCTAIDATGCPVAGEYTQRMTMTLNALVNSDLVILLVTGPEKLKVIVDAILNKNDINKPVSMLLGQTRTPVEIYWAE